MTDPNSPHFYKGSHCITITVSGAMLRDIDTQLSDRQPACRERFILDLLKAHLVSANQDYCRHCGQPISGLGEYVKHLLTDHSETHGGDCRRRTLTECALALYNTQRSCYPRSAGGTS